MNLSQISTYPIKSTAGIHLSSSWVDHLGLSFDRRFVLCDEKKRFITARKNPRLCLVQANITATGLILTAPNMPRLIINYQDLSNDYQDVVVWQDSINAQIAAKQHHQWFSEYLGKPCQLLYFGELSTRILPTKSVRSNQLAFADGYPLLLISQASLTDLNSRVTTDDQVSMPQFRPNIVVDNCNAFAEDTWSHIRIGEVEFEVKKPCVRCVFTTVNPLTAEKHPQREPLATLKSYRKTEGGDIMFGQNIVPLNQGQIKLGDTVHVLAYQTAITFSHNDD
jgi:uncharacterized protein YcbX